MEIPGLISPAVLWVSGVFAVCGTGGTLLLLVLTWKQYRQARRDAQHP